MSKSSPPTEIELISRIRSGDHSAEIELLEQFDVVKRVQIIVRTRLTAPQDDYQDLVSEIVMAVLINLRAGKFDPEKGKLCTYIWGIARNKIRDYLKPKAARHRQSLPLDDHHLSVQAFSMETKEDMALLRSVVASLDDKYKEIIILRYYKELAIEEIGQQLELSNSQVYNRIHYALGLIREKTKNKNSFQNLGGKS